ATRSSNESSTTIRQNPTKRAKHPRASPNPRTGPLRSELDAGVQVVLAAALVDRTGLVFVQRGVLELRIVQVVGVKRDAEVVVAPQAQRRRHVVDRSLIERRAAIQAAVERRAVVVG